MIDLFNEKLNKLPANIQDILLSDFGKQIEKGIVNHFAAGQGKLALLGNIVTDLFFGDIKLSKLAFILKSNFGLNDADSNQMACDVLGKRLLIANNFLREKYGEGVDDVIRKLGSDPTNYQKTVYEFIDAIKKEKSKVNEIEEMEKEEVEEAPIDLSKVKFDIQAEMHDSLEVFEISLLPILENNKGDMLREYNLTLIQLLGDYKDFKDKMEKALYQNNEVITKKKFVLDNREQEPTVRNWLIDFIEKNGTSMFNNMDLTRFVSESENAKLLDAEEKKVLSRMLQVYRNVKFFPNCFEGLPIEQWEIIPTEKEEKVSRAAQLPHVKATGREALVKELKGSVDDYAPGSLEREILEEESERDREYHKLLLLMKKYPEGSLERRAVEEEIKKLEN